MTGYWIEFIYIKLKGILQYDDFKLIKQHNDIVKEKYLERKLVCQ